jgi:hypothetical protein
MHHYTLAVATNLASDLSALGEFAAACDLGKRTYTRLREQLGDRDPAGTYTGLNLALDLRAAGDDHAADELSTELLGLLAEILGPDHPEVQNASNERRLDCDYDAPEL